MASANPLTPALSPEYGERGARPAPAGGAR